MADNNRDRGRRHAWVVAGAGFGVLTVNSAVAIYRAATDKAAAATVAFVVSWCLTLLLLLFAALREYERARPAGSSSAKRPRAAWPPPPHTTVHNPSVAAAIMPWCADAAGGDGQHRGGDRKVAALAMASLGVMACDAALAVHRTRGGDAVSVTLVLAAYAALLVLVGIFIREFAAGRARGAGGGGVGAVDAAH